MRRYPLAIVLLRFLWKPIDLQQAYVGGSISRKQNSQFDFSRVVCADVVHRQILAVCQSAGLLLAVSTPILAQLS
jgi:hypothetical protein